MRYGITPPIWWPFRWWPSSSEFNPGVGLWHMVAISKKPRMDTDSLYASVIAYTESASMEIDELHAIMSATSKMATMIGA